VLFLGVLVVAYFGARVFLSSRYIADAVVSFLSERLNCDIVVERAKLDPFSALYLKGFSLSYRKTNKVHDVLRADGVELDFDPLVALGNLRFDSVRLSNASVRLERDSEGWITAGRIITAATFKNPAVLEISANRLNVFLGCCVLPLEEVRANVATALPKVTVRFQGRLYGSMFSGSGSAILREDPQFEGEFRVEPLRIENIQQLSLPSDLKLSGGLECSVFVKGRASSRHVVEKGSYLKLTDVAAVFPGGEKMFSVRKIVLLYQPPVEDKGKPVVRVQFEDGFLDTGIWLHTLDSPDKLIMRNRISAMAFGLPDAVFAVEGDRLLLALPIGEVPLTELKVSITKSGNSVSFDGMKGATCGGEVNGKWVYRRGEGSPRYEVTLRFARINFSELIARTSLSRCRVRGTLSGQLKFASKAFGAAEPSGEGFLQLAMGDVWQFPVFSEIPKALGLSPEETRLPQEVHGAFAIEPSGIRFTNLNLTSGALILRGEGSISYNGEVSLRFDVIRKVAREKSLPVFDDLFGFIADAFSTERKRIEVYGNLSGTSVRLVTEAVPLPKGAGR